jgi:2OG-Fe(II) oxygenase superfamily
MFLFTPSDRLDGVEPISIPSPSPTSGLYIKTRSGKQIKVSIAPNCLAFQTGEALECMSQGRLRATPHAVKAGTGLSVDVKELLRRNGFLDGAVSRETMAVFMQPDIDEVRQTDRDYIRYGYLFVQR